MEEKENSNHLESPNYGSRSGRSRGKWPGIRQTGPGRERSTRKTGRQTAINEPPFRSLSLYKQGRGGTAEVAPRWLGPGGLCPESCPIHYVSNRRVWFFAAASPLRRVTSRGHGWLPEHDWRTCYGLHHRLLKQLSFRSNTSAHYTLFDSPKRFRCHFISSSTKKNKEKKINPRRETRRPPRGDHRKPRKIRDRDNDWKEWHKERKSLLCERLVRSIQPPLDATAVAVDIPALPGRKHFPSFFLKPPLDENRTFRNYFLFGGNIKRVKCGPLVFVPSKLCGLAKPFSAHPHPFKKILSSHKNFIKIFRLL